jgi:hypothetical protein
MPTTVMAGSSRGSCSRLPRNSGSDGEKFILKDQVLEVPNVDGRLHVARKARKPDEWDPSDDDVIGDDVIGEGLPWPIRVIGRDRRVLLVGLGERPLALIYMAW